MTQDVGDQTVEDGEVVNEAASAALGMLTIMDAPPHQAQTSTFRAGTEDEHEDVAWKRRAMRKRALDSTCKLRRSTRLAEKEQPIFEQVKAQHSIG